MQNGPRNTSSPHKPYVDVVQKRSQNMPTHKPYAGVQNRFLILCKTVPEHVKWAACFSVGKMIRCSCQEAENVGWDYNMWHRPQLTGSKQHLALSSAIDQCVSRLCCFPSSSLTAVSDFMSRVIMLCVGSLFVLICCAFSAWNLFCHAIGRTQRL